MVEMNMTRRVLVGGLISAPFVRTARAQAAWPNRPVRVIVPYPPAGGADTTARIVFAKVGEMFGQQFVIEKPWRRGRDDCRGHGREGGSRWLHRAA